MVLNTKNYSLFYLKEGYSIYFQKLYGRVVKLNVNRFYIYRIRLKNQRTIFIPLEILFLLKSIKRMQ